MKNIVTDIVLEPGLETAHIALHDIDAARLATSEKSRTALPKQQAPHRPSATLKRREALQNATFVITMIQVGGYEPATIIDFDIPKKYGLRQTIGDTLGIGGIMRGLRTVPVLKQLLMIWPNAALMRCSYNMSIRWRLTASPCQNLRHN